MHSAIGAYGGVVFKTLGDAVCAAFVRAPDALAAACAIQQSLGAEDWRRFGLPPERPLRVRMAIHTGMADPRHGDYVGPPLNRAARILSAGHGGQVLLSLAARELVADALPEGVSLRDLGTYQLRGLHGTGAGRPAAVLMQCKPYARTDAVQVRHRACGGVFRGEGGGQVFRCIQKPRQFPAALGGRVCAIAQAPG